MNSTSALQSSDATSKISDRVEEQQRTGDRGSKKRSSLNRPGEHPFIDISNLDYKAYRHKLVEATLRKRYDDSQPPGDVVLNSLHLNSADSVIGVRLNDRYDHSLFDFVEEYYDVAEATSRRNLQRPRPMDHFLSKGARRPRTTEKETETIPDESIEYGSRAREDDGNFFPSENDNDNLAKLPGMDNNGNPCVHSLSRNISLEDNVVSAIARSDLNSKLQIPRRETEIPRSRDCVEKARPGRDVENDDCPRFADSGRKESSVERRPASVGNASETSSPKGCALSRAVTLPVGQKRATKSPRRPKTTATSRSRDFKENLEDHPAVIRGFPSSSKHSRAEAEKANFISASSSEIVSVCSDSSSKRRRNVDETSRRSRESSISRASSRPPWLSGNLHGTSFNRKYGNITKEYPAKSTTRPTTTTTTRESGLSRRFVVSSREDRRSKESDVSRNPPRRRAASFIAPREKEFIDGASIEQRLTTSPGRQPRDKLKDVGRGGGGRLESNERERTWKAPDSTGEGISAITRDNVTSARARASVAASALVTTRTTKEPRLTSGDAGADRRKRENTSPDAGRDRREEERSAKFNRGGRRRLRSAENPCKGASLSPKIELSAEVLSPADDTDKSAIPDGEKPLLPERVITRIDPRGDVAKDESADEARPARNTEATTTGKDIKSNNINGVARSKVPKIMQSLGTNGGEPASANNLPESDKSGVSSTSQDPARRTRDANSGTKGGLNGAKLNTRSNSATDEMRRDETSSKTSKTEFEILRERDILGKVDPDAEELLLPRRDSKMDLVMNSGLKRYIKMLKQSLLKDDDDNKEDAVSLVSLSLSDVILSEPKAPLSPEETRELQSVLNKIERNPELLCKEP
ncbi:microtubule-associated protein futsch-like protein [Lasius niger]|uniref:Microtubule-associated protein futsch-like protein n=1 Tax=Lasius niger TaxID=67767 RepID=A0A0J7KW99_LASNI|nr:microtubule-associated protein futsch-like protein [Lasius niger]